MENNIQKFTSFRNKYDTFYFESFKLNLSDFYIEVNYHYSFDKKIDFNHVLRIKKNEQLKNIIDFKKYEKIIICLGIIEGINYYKMICPKNIKIKCMKLNEEENKWWEKLYYKGLGELLYLNGIKVLEDEFVKFLSCETEIDKIKLENVEGNLILVGGGKDSNTSLELLSDEKEKNNILIVNPREASFESAKIAGYNEEEIIIVNRIIDKNLIEYNKEGYLNGHIPFSAMLSFLSTFIACMTNKKYVVVSNESSANEDTVDGANHQYSKSFEYENDFRKYLKEFVFENDNVEYYSILRPLFELQIVKLFVKYEKYLKIFKSCNIGSKIIEKKEIWCNKCPKCLFVYILLLSQLEENRVIDIIGSNMLDNEEFKEDFNKLIGVLEEKPFECIGTKDEVNAAMSIIINKEEYNTDNIPCLIKYYKEECKEKHFNDEEIKKIIYNFDDNNNVPRETIEKIKNLLDIK